MEYENNLNLQSMKTEDVEHFSSIIEYFITKQFGSLAHLLIICFGCLIFANLCVFWILILCVLYNWKICFPHSECHLSSPLICSAAPSKLHVAPFLNSQGYFLYN